MLSIINKLTELATDEIDSDSSLRTCGNCTYFKKFKKEEIDFLSKLFKKEYKSDTGICTGYTDYLGNPIIVNAQTTENEVKEIHGENICFEWDESIRSEYIDGEYQSLERSHWYEFE